MTRATLLALLLGACILPTASAGAVTTAPSAKVSPQAQTLAETLVAAMYDEATMRTTMTEEVDRHNAAQMTNDKEFADFARQYPAFHAKLMQRTKQEVAAILQEKLAALRTSYAELLGGQMNAAQLDATTAMLRTTAGKTIMTAGFKPAGEKREPVDKQALLKTMSPSERNVFAAFVQNGAGSKFGASAQALGEIAETWNADFMTGVDTRLQKAAEEETKIFLASLPETKTASGN